MGRYTNLRKANDVAEDITPRLDYLRRNSSLDVKTGLFYLPPPRSENTLHDFFRMLPTSPSLISGFDNPNIPLLWNIIAFVSIRRNVVVQRSHQPFQTLLLPSTQKDGVSEQTLN
jgi:hypothetical protein